MIDQIIEYNKTFVAQKGNETQGGISGWFSSGGPRVRFLPRYDGEVSEPLVGAREVGSPCEWRGGARHCSRAMVGESGLETC